MSFADDSIHKATQVGVPGSVFKKGAVGNLHQHFHEQCTYIISGKFEFNINGVKKILGAGDSTYKEPNVIHGAVCLEEGSLIDIFTPERKDFLK